jgi:phage shock protein E
MISPDKVDGVVTWQMRAPGLRILAGIVAVLSLTAACGATGDQMDAVMAPVEAAGGAAVVPAGAGTPAPTPTGPAPLISPSQGLDLLSDGAVLIDVRTPGEFDEIRIDGAVLIDVSAPDFDARVADLDPNATYVVYCRSGNRSVPATQRMLDAGLGSVYNMGGIIDWVADGRPTITG